MASRTHTGQVRQVIGTAEIFTHLNNVMAKEASIVAARLALVGIALEYLHADPLPFPADRRLWCWLIR